MEPSVKREWIDERSPTIEGEKSAGSKKATKRRRCCQAKQPLAEAEVPLSQNRIEADKSSSLLLLSDAVRSDERPAVDLQSYVYTPISYITASASASSSLNLFHPPPPRCDLIQHIRPNDILPPALPDRTALVQETASRVAVREDERAACDGLDGVGM